jgi:hypothetical protein
MAVQFYNGQYYDVMPATNWLYSGGAGSGYSAVPGINGYAKAITPPAMETGSSSQPGTGMFGDPFGTAMSGTKSGTLQPYINRMTQNADNALNGGLLNYAPQSMVAGDAGGTPVNSTPPQGFNLQSALLNGEFGKRSWMK